MLKLISSDTNERWRHLISLELRSVSVLWLILTVPVMETDPDSWFCFLFLHWHEGLTLWLDGGVARYHDEVEMKDSAQTRMFMH